MALRGRRVGGREQVFVDLSANVGPSHLKNSLFQNCTCCNQQSIVTISQIQNFAILAEHEDEDCTLPFPPLLKETPCIYLYLIYKRRDLIVMIHTI